MGSLVVCCGLLGSTIAQAEPFEQRPPRREERAPMPVREVSREVQRDLQRDMAPRAAQPLQIQQQAPSQPLPGQVRQIDPRSYEGRAEEQRRAMEAATRNADMSRRTGRLTPDERRDLRRQINEVGQDLYANPPHH